MGQNNELAESPRKRPAGLFWAAIFMLVFGIYESLQCVAMFLIVMFLPRAASENGLSTTSLPSLGVLLFTLWISFMSAGSLAVSVGLFLQKRWARVLALVITFLYVLDWIKVIFESVIIKSKSLGAASLVIYTTFLAALLYMSYFLTRVQVKSEFK